MSEISCVESEIIIFKYCAFIENLESFLRKIHTRKMIVSLVVLTVILIFLINYLVEKRKLLKVTSQFQGPKPHFLLGNGKEFVDKDPAALFNKLLSLHEIYGKRIALWGLFNDVGMSFMDPNDVEVIVSGTRILHKSTDYDLIKAWLGEGLLMSFGKKWATRRKIITPTFHFTILEQFVKSFDKQTNILVEKLMPHDGKGDLNIYTYITLTALDIICETSMGAEIHAQDHPENPYVQSVKAMSRIMFMRIFSIFRHFPLLFPFTPLFWEQRRHLKVLHDFTAKVIAQRREQLFREQSNQLKKELNSGNEKMNVDFLSQPKEDDFKDLYLNRSESKERLTFLDLLLKATVDGKPLSDADIREEVDTFMFEGHDTTTSGISFTLYHLSQHADIQERVYEELKGIFEGEMEENLRVTYSHLQDMKYLEMVIKESLRITPPVPMFGRKTTEDIIIGGQKFAMLEMKMTISKILMNFKLLPHNPEAKLTLQGDLVLKPVNGVYLKVEKRNKVL
uniref:Cytochrome n=1 Tax=Lutzomyia longipalpis TaxID=7200 RepID=A0A1B0GLI8_LUTLO